MNNENNLNPGSAPHAGNASASSSSQKSLSQWLSYLESIHPSAIDMGLDRVKEVANAIKNDKKEINIGGPDLLSQNEIAELALRAYEKPMKIIHF